MDDKLMKILVGYDGSDCADAALDDLLRAGLPARAKVVVLTAADVFLPPVQQEEPASTEYVPHGIKLAWERAERAFQEAQNLATAACQKLQALFPEWEIDPDAKADTPHWALILRANEWKPDLVVVGSHGRSALGRMYFGSVSQKVLYESRCSVRIARGRNVPASTPKRLILAVDGSPDSDAMLETVISRQWEEGTQVRLITVVELFHQYGTEPGAQMNRIESIQKIAAVKLRNARVKVTPIVKEGDAKNIIVREAESWEADCIFLGAQGHRFMERILLGSVSSSVAARAGCSVEVVRRNTQL